MTDSPRTRSSNRRKQRSDHIVRIGTRDKAVARLGYRHRARHRPKSRTAHDHTGTNIPRVGLHLSIRRYPRWDARCCSHHNDGPQHLHRHPVSSQRAATATANSICEMLSRVSVEISITSELAACIFVIATIPMVAALLKCHEISRCIPVDGELCLSRAIGLTRNGS